MRWTKIRKQEPGKKPKGIPTRQVIEIAMEIDPQSERRLFARMGLDFQADISTWDHKASLRTDSVRLVNISGGGVRFTSHKPGMYYIEQPVEISIDLPGRGEIRASMKASGRVLRIEAEAGNEEHDRSAKMAITISLDTPLRLVRST